MFNHTAKLICINLIVTKNIAAPLFFTLNLFKMLSIIPAQNARVH